MILFCKFQARYTDIQCINRYFGWYQDTGHTELIARQLTYDLQQWHNILGKPLIVSEYGADTIPGLHSVSVKQIKIDW